MRVQKMRARVSLECDKRYVIVVPRSSNVHESIPLILTQQTVVEMSCLLCNWAHRRIHGIGAIKWQSRMVSLDPWIGPLKKKKTLISALINTSTVFD